MAQSHTNEEAVTTTTTFFISNLHCPSCITSIQFCLEDLGIQPTSISHSIIHHSVTIRHNPETSPNTITSSLEKAGFEVFSVAQADREPTFRPWQPEDTGINEDWGLEQAVQRWKTAWKDKDVEVENSRKRKRHVEQCAQCLKELRSLGSSEALMDKAQPFSDASDIERGVSISTEEGDAAKDTEKLGSVTTATPELFRATFSIDGMTCSACVTNVSQAISQHSFAQDINVNLLSNSATVTFSGRDNDKVILESIDDAGYDISLNEIEKLGNKQKQSPDEHTWKATFSVTGMTCAACVRSLTAGLEEPVWITNVQVNLISNSATVAFEGTKDKAKDIVVIIEELGFDASVENLQGVDATQSSSTERNIALRVTGMYCHHCPPRILQALSDRFGKDVTIDEECSVTSPLLKLRYQPQPPTLTLRHIIDTINAVDDEVQVSIFNPPTLEQRSREIHAAERRKILLRFTLSLVTAVPTFIIGIVYMTLLNYENGGRRYLMQHIWAGTVSRADWALFMMGTVIYVFAADIFHIRSLQGIFLMWKPSSKTPLSHRLLRFGNMNMLISLGTSIAYFASIAALAINATSAKAMGEGQAYYFDSVVFLTLFLLGGRGLEAWSKAKTGDAVAALGSLRPDTALLVTHATSSDSTMTLNKTATELLEVGDVVRVLHGSSPPFDGTIIDGETRFDEASLTGEARLIAKHAGDQVFSGTINKGSPIDVRMTSISGTSMLDQIIKVVREGQTKRAPVERVADIITSRFVPFIVLIGIATWIIWLSLGLSGALPVEYLDSEIGGWPFWSLQFSIAVFVVACPCGIGLAAPTALFVGGGLAAKYGILVKGGGEAFQEASMLDCVVFDKTGTLTQGTAPAVTDCKTFGNNDEKIMMMAKALEENSSHPVARAVVEHSKAKIQETEGTQALNVEELPGKGLKGTFGIDSETQITAIIGNEALMADFDVRIDLESKKLIESWKQQGKSIALLSTSSSSSNTGFTLAAAFAIADPLRPEAATIVKWLQDQGLEVWMVSGDNATTANSVGAAVGIPSSNIMAGVLPEQKADKIKYLQQTLVPRHSRGLIGSRKQRATVAMCGDGINDAPALATADLSIAIGSGSDVALSTASFVLVTSDLRALVRLLELSRVVFRRVVLNFVWALVYNLVALPVAAGALYAITSGGKHVRLDPVWASLAMALSSVSVVSSSLLLRTRIPILGFRPSKVM
ncbi:heavy metal translocatin [Aureobasidium pullulans]|uniref:Heavy metal translocatin n=1 Tax=Aureobasidium pullulans TaxID=5580 RepID=A0A4S9K8X8_AURPU|nr:heavy metal translocatin [Aureobasidium pullulans]THY11685.1 heavy metal translocatin [Aureobasidium pullulans]THZ72449.1 heavy metal translocatin [Aureobasidium pullulans]